jgi:hypothetical protein
MGKTAAITQNQFRKNELKNIKTSMLQLITFNQSVLLTGLKIDFGTIASHHLKQALVHHPKPQGRAISQGKHAKVTAGQGGQMIKMAQGLIAPHGVGMMIRMALQVIHQPIGKNMVAVPRMVGLANFIFPWGSLGT